jgi:hypothetical protein
VFSSAATPSIGDTADTAVTAAAEPSWLALRTAHAIGPQTRQRSPAAPELGHSIAGAPMPWKCPACQTPIAHNGDASEPKRVYRCHVCRLELTLDETTHKLTLVPLVTGIIRRATDAEP